MDLLPLDEADAFLQPFRRQIHGIERHLSPDSVIQVVQNGLLVRREKRRTAQGQETVPQPIPGLLPHPEIEGIVESPGIIVFHISDRISRGSTRGSMTIMETRLPLEEYLVIMLPDDLLRERWNLFQVLDCLDIFRLQGEGIEQLAVIGRIPVCIRNQCLHPCGLPPKDLVRCP